VVVSGDAGNGEPAGDPVGGALDEEGALAIEEPDDFDLVFPVHEGDRLAGGGDRGLDEIVQYGVAVVGEDLVAHRAVGALDRLVERGVRGVQRCHVDVDAQRGEHAIFVVAEVNRRAPQFAAVAGAGTVAELVVVVGLGSTTSQCGPIRWGHSGPDNPSVRSAVMVSPGPPNSSWPRNAGNNYCSAI
jgi:hypothetical protein